MNYLNLHTDTLRSVEYLGAEPIERATWLNLLGWCASQENGGRIVGGKDWPDRKWQQLCGVTRDEALTECELYWTDGRDVVVFAGYQTLVDSKKLSDMMSTRIETLKKG
mgnify:CR=1 FL=1